MSRVSPRRVPVAVRVGVPVVPSETELVVEAITATDGGLTISVSCHRRRAPCPRCGRAADRVHSRYTRTLADLPWQGRAVCLSLTTRKFYCDWRTCAARASARRVALGCSVRAAQRSGAALGDWQAENTRSVAAPAEPTVRLQQLHPAAAILSGRRPPWPRSIHTQRTRRRRPPVLEAGAACIYTIRCDSTHETSEPGSPPSTS
jgi:zinc-finger of transposase IS204/IS1001/IS1096/IS1165